MKTTQKSQLPYNPAVLENMPWEERPTGNVDPIWRYSANPVIPRNSIPKANSIFNSAIAPFGEGYAGVFRVDDRCRNMRLHVGFSYNGLKWDINETPIEFICEDINIGAFVCGYDPRVVYIEDRYYITWCNYYHGATIGLAWTKDFRNFHQEENAFLPFNRNGVLFPEKINGNFAMMSRPSDNGHTPFGEIFYSESPDLAYWGKHRWMMKPESNWEHTKIGPGPIPIKTSEGWLMIYHGVLNSCNGFVYSIGAALLDQDEPWKVLSRANSYMLAPTELYECVGDVQNVTFPCAALHDPKTGRLAIYYGGADTVVALAFGYVHGIIDFVKKNKL